jgi:hypothetical protein
MYKNTKILRWAHNLVEIKEFTEIEEPTIDYRVLGLISQNILELNISSLDKEK